MESEIKKRQIFFAAVVGTYVDFRKIDLSPWGIQGGFVESPETKEYIHSISIKEFKERNWEHVKDATQGTGHVSSMHGDWEHVNFLWPIDLNNPPPEHDYFEAIEAIRVIHPSEIYIRDILYAEYFEGQGVFFEGWTTYSMYSFYKYEKPEEHYFIYPEENLKETNEFLAYYKENYNKRDYIRNAISYYSNSFRVNSSEMSFICLCICLETIVPGKEQLSYRFRRNLAVLCSDTNERGKRIYRKAKKLYGYRSKLVHSGMTSKDFKKFDLFFEYAQILASRMIVEMLIHDIPTIEELDRKITEIGFGHKKEISESYKEFKGNIMTWYKVSEYNFED